MKKSEPKKKVTMHVTETGAKHYMHWLCMPGNKCVPTSDEPMFTDNTNWRIFRIMAEFVEGFEFLSKLKGEVSIFGSARALPNSRYYQEAQRLGFLLGKGAYTVITGGGPGIMEAANRGAFEAGGESVGLNIQLPIEQRTNSYVKRGVGFHYFFTRKVMLSASAQAYVFMPGGFGTLDEMSEMVTLKQTGKIPSDVPIILYGKKYWQPFLDWVAETMCKDYRYIETEEIGIINVVDSPEEAMKIINKTKERPFG